MEGTVSSAERRPKPEQALLLTEGLRAEYAALAGFMGTANTFRFTILGLFLATAGLLLTDPTTVKAALLFVASLTLWFAELRTRSLLSYILKRGSEIERNWESGSGPEKQFMTQLGDEWGAEDRSTLKELPRRRICVFIWDREFPVVRHGLLLDLTFLAVAAAAVAQLVLLVA